MTSLNHTKSKEAGISLLLFSPKGRMYSLWLPGVAEGSRSFNENGKNPELDFLSFDAREDQWHARCLQNASFVMSDGTRFDQKVLGASFTSYILHGSRRYLLFAQRMNPSQKVFHHYRMDENYKISIGRLPHNDICYQNRFVSREHALLSRSNGRWYINDLNKGNGVYLNDNRIPQGTAVQLKPGDVLSILGLKIIIGSCFLSINDGIEDLVMNPNRLIPFQVHDHRNQMLEISGKSLRKPFNRPPQRLNELVPGTIKIDAPPMAMRGDNLPLILRFGGPMVMSGTSMLSGNYASVLSMLMFPLLTNRFTEKQKKEYEELRTTKYTEYLNEKKQEISQEIRYEQDYLNWQYPLIEGSLKELEEKLWARGKRSKEFASLRAGYGERPLQAEIQYANERFSLDRDPLEEAMFDVAARKYKLQDVPICVDLAEDFYVSVTGKPEQRQDMLCQFLMQLAFWHSFEDLKIILVGDVDQLPKGSLIRFLPHLWNEELTLRFLATDKTEGFAISEHLASHINLESSVTRDLLDLLKNSPYYVVLAWDKKVFDSMSIFESIAKENHNPGISVVTFFDTPHKDAQTVVQLSNHGVHKVSRLRQARNTDSFFNLDNFANIPYAGLWKMISNISIQEAQSANAFPKMISFMEMFKAGKVDHLNATKRWKENNPTKSLAVPVGVCSDGSLFEMDLHEKYQGPHGLVAGMTGSGKSEFLITYILSLALNFSPYEVSFVLIDYKGGGLVGAFLDYENDAVLPHLAGTITNLDGSAVQRAMLSIESEMKRRQILFNEAKKAVGEGTMDIYSYQALYRRGLVEQPLPHLFIVSDEFAELKQQEPQFMDALISAARIGRSLGVHLILATQKPSGVVNDQINSNSKFRVCLKVQSRADSDEMLRRPDAAEIKETGRFFLQVGYNEFFEQGQSAWCGAPYQPADQVIENKDDSIEVIDNTGQKLISVKPEVKKQESGQSQLTAIVKYLIQAAKKENVEKYFLWEDPLPKEMNLETLNEKLQEEESETLNGNDLIVPLGMADDPSYQSQFPYLFNLSKCRNLLIIGGNKSGKTTYIETLLLQTISRYSPDQVQFYVLDFSTKLLKVFDQAPHCGGVWTQEEEESITRFFSMLAKTIKQRKKLFVDAGVSGFEEYMEHHDIPLILVAIDNYPVLKSWAQGKSLDEQMPQIIRDANSAGIKFILSANTMEDVNYRVKREIEDRIGFTAKNRFEFEDILGVRCQITPADLPGHGLFKYGERPLEFICARFQESENDQSRMDALRSEMADLSEQYKGFKRPERVVSINKEESYQQFVNDIPLGRIPLGYDVKKISKVSVPFKQLYCMGLYMGNENSSKSVLMNFLQAALREDMKLVVVRQDRNSEFDERAFLEMLDNFDNPVVLTNSQNDSVQLWNLIAQETGERKKLRNAYAQNEGIAAEDPQLIKLAGNYIREHSKPLLVLFEDFKQFEESLDDKYKNGFTQIFKRGKGYNYYFLGCFYPAKDVFSAPGALTQAFLEEKFVLLNGGRFDKVSILDLPSEYSRMNNTSETAQACLLHYRGGIHPLWMPMEIREEPVEDPDDLPII